MEMHRYGSVFFSSRKLYIIVYIFSETSHEGQASLEFRMDRRLVLNSEPPASLSQVTIVTGTYRHTWALLSSLNFLGSKKC